jgi:hypothetical protein
MKHFSTSSMSTAKLYLRRGLLVAAGAVALSTISQAANAQFSSIPNDPFSIQNVFVQPESGPSLEGPSSAPPPSSGPSLVVPENVVGADGGIDFGAVAAANPNDVGSQVLAAVPESAVEVPVESVPVSEVPLVVPENVVGADGGIDFGAVAAANPNDVGSQVLAAVPESAVEVPVAPSLDDPDSINVSAAPIKGGGTATVDLEIGNFDGQITGRAKNNGDISVKGNGSLPIGAAVLNVAGQANNRGPGSFDTTLTLPVADNVKVIVGEGTGGTTAGISVGEKDDVNGSIKTNFDSGETTGELNFPGETLNTQLTGSTGGKGEGSGGIKFSTPGGPGAQKPLDTKALGANIDQETRDFNAGRPAPNLDSLDSLEQSDADATTAPAEQIIVPETGGADLKTLADANPKNFGLQVLNATPEASSDPLVSGVNSDETLVAANNTGVVSDTPDGTLIASSKTDEIKRRCIAAGAAVCNILNPVNADVMAPPSVSEVGSKLVETQGKIEDRTKPKPGQANEKPKDPKPDPKNGTAPKADQFIDDFGNAALNAGGNFVNGVGNVLNSAGEVVGKVAPFIFGNPAERRLN